MTREELQLQYAEVVPLAAGAGVDLSIYSMRAGELFRKLVQEAREPTREECAFMSSMSAQMRHQVQTSLRDQQRLAKKAD
jgi:hypothetical protein